MKTKNIVLIIFLAAGYAVKMIHGAGVSGDYIHGTQPDGTNYFLGKVGIGTNKPLCQLHVVGDVKVSGPLRVPRQGDLLMGIYTNGDAGDGAYSGGVGANMPSGDEGNLLFHNGSNWVALTNFYYDEVTGRLYLNNTNSGVYLDGGGLEGKSSSFYRDWINITNKSIFGGAGQAGIINSTTNDSGKFLKGDGSWQAVVTQEIDPTITNKVRKSATVAPSPVNNALLVSDGIDNTWSLNFNGTFDGHEGSFYRNWYNITNKALFTGAGTTGLISSVVGEGNKFLKGDGSWQTIIGESPGYIKDAWLIWDSANSVIITNGEGICRDKYWQIRNPINKTISSIPAGTNIVYVYIDYENSTFPYSVAITNTTTAPSYNTNWCGWYVGNDRCIGAILTTNRTAGTTPGVVRFITCADGAHIWKVSFYLLLNGNPNDTWQSPTKASSLFLPRNATHGLFAIHGEDDRAGGCISIAPVEYTLMGSSWTRIVLSAGGYDEWSLTDWMELGPSRDIKWFGPDNDDNLNWILICGFKIRR
mgnify:CR=1 FL=1